MLSDFWNVLCNFSSCEHRLIPGLSAAARGSSGDLREVWMGLCCSASAGSAGRSSAHCQNHSLKSFISPHPRGFFCPISLSSFLFACGGVYLWRSWNEWIISEFEHDLLVCAVTCQAGHCLPPHFWHSQACWAGCLFSAAVSLEIVNALSGILVCIFSCTQLCKCCGGDVWEASPDAGFELSVPGVASESQKEASVLVWLVVAATVTTMILPQSLLYHLCLCSFLR